MFKLMFSKIKNLQRRQSGTYFALFHIPKSIQEIAGKKQVWKSLQTKHRILAIEKIVVFSKETASFFDYLVQIKQEKAMQDQQIKDLLIDFFIKPFNRQQEFLKRKEVKIDEIKAHKYQYNKDFHEYLLENAEDFLTLEQKEKEFDGHISFLKEKKERLKIKNNLLTLSDISRVQKKILNKLINGKLIQPKKTKYILGKHNLFKIIENKKEFFKVNRIYGWLFYQFLELNKEPEVITNMSIDFFKKLMNGFNINNFEKLHQSPKSFNILAQTWLKSKNESDVSEDYKKKQKQNVDVISSIFQELDLESASITEVEDKLKILMKMPKNKNKIYPKLTIEEVIERHPNCDKISGKTFETYNLTFNSVLKEAYRLEELSINLVEKIKLPKIKDDEIVRKPFKVEQLNKLFKSKSFIKQSEQKDFWLPIISLYTGMRIHEICQLLTSDIKYKNNIHYIDIVESAENSDIKKKLKNKTAKRVVPIHKDLIDLGFLKYVKKQNKTNNLFPLLVKDNQVRSDLASKRFYTTSIKAKIKEEGICFHSFRHTFRDAGRNNDVDAKKMEQLGGWKSDKSLAEHYGDGFNLEKLNEAIQNIKYKGLNLNAVKKKLEEV